MLKFVVGNIVTEVIATTGRDLSILYDVLKVEDPDKKREEAYRSGYWDGFHRLFDGDASCFLTGLLNYVLSRCAEANLEVKLTYQSGYPPPQIPFEDIHIPPDYLDGIELRDYQILAARLGVFRQRGLFDLPTRSGKTEVAIAVIKYLNHPTLFLVNNIRLLHQTYRRFLKRGLVDVGRVGGHEKNSSVTYCEYGHKYTIGMVQSIYAKLKKHDQKLIRMMSDVEVLFFDESHHVGAASWLAIGQTCPANYRYGLSATVFSSYLEKKLVRDFHLVGVTGDMILSVSPRHLIRRGYLPDIKVMMLRVDKSEALSAKWRTVYKYGIVENTQINTMMCQLAAQMYREGFTVLMLVQQVKHGENLLKRLHGLGIPSVFAYGSEQVSYISPHGGVCKETWDYDQLVDYIEGSEAAVMVGSAALEEGLDFPKVNAVLILGGYESFYKTIQRSGRSLTAKAGKEVVFIVDVYHNFHKYLRKHSLERMDHYQKVYELDHIPFGIADLNAHLREPVIFDYCGLFKKKSPMAIFRGGA